MSLTLRNFLNLLVTQIALRPLTLPRQRFVIRAHNRLRFRWVRNANTRKIANGRSNELQSTNTKANITNEVKSC